MPSLEEMTTEEILSDMCDQQAGEPFVELVDELSRRLSAMHEEIAALKAENAVMRELCEAYCAQRAFMGGDILPLIRRVEAADDAYRAMKERKV